MSFGFVGRLFSGIKGYYNEINGATLTGAIDVIIIEQDDGTFVSSPFHVRFGKMGVLRSREKVVDIEINGNTSDLHMKLGEAGEAFFVEEVGELTEEVPDYLATSPILSSMNLMMDGVGALKLQAQQSDEAKVTEWQKKSVHENVGDDEGADDETTLPQELPHKVSLKDLKSDSSHEEQRPPSEKTKRKVYTKKKKLRQGKSASSSRGLHQSHAAMGLNQEGVFKMDSSESSDDEELKSLSALSKSISMPLPTSPDEEEKPHIKIWKKSATIEAFMHPLSEPELEPEVTSPLPSRCPSPKSDTEVDVRRAEDFQRSLLVEDSGTWEWGAFPVTPGSEATKSKMDEEFEEGDGSKPPSKGIFKYWTSSPGKEVKKEIKDIYLDQLTLEDPEMANLYLGTPKGFQSIKDREDDNESGRGPSLPQSPHSVEGAIGGPSVSFLQSEVRHLGRVSLSLCGGLADPEGVNLDKFMQKVVTFGDLCENPNMIINPDLVVKVDEGYFNWPTAAPMILSQMVFHQDLPEMTSQGLVKEHMPKKEKKKGYSWFLWRRGETAPSSSNTCELQVDTSPKSSDVGSPPMSPSPSATSTPQKIKPEKGAESEEHHSSSEADSIHSDPEGLSSPNAVGRAESQRNVTSSIRSTSLGPTASRSASLSPNPRSSSVKSDSAISGSKSATLDMNKMDVEGMANIGGSSKSVDNLKSSSARNEDSVKIDMAVESTADTKTESKDESKDESKVETKIDMKVEDEDIKSDKFKKTLRLSSEQIAKLQLKEGQNEICFSVTTQYQGTSRCTSHIYLWKHSDHIVVSDIDGTITKSDVLGQILPIMGRDWSQSGVASLFNRIHRNGYKLLYLSARAIGQSRITKDLLRNIKQGEVVLPDGPLLLNPTSLISAFHREVITKKPEEFKISCLKDINALFPTSPFYAGFGNKINDVWTYRALSIPNVRIFTINHRGELRHDMSYTFLSSYTRLSDVVDHFFPPVDKNRGIAGEFSSVSYWREPIPEIDVEVVDETKSGNSDTKKVRSSEEVK